MALPESLGLTGPWKRHHPYDVDDSYDFEGEYDGLYVDEPYENPQRYVEFNIDAYDAEEPDDFSLEFKPQFQTGYGEFGLMRPARPEHRLWGRFAFPAIPMGLLLWENGRVKAVSSFHDSEFLACDRAILGGQRFIVPDDSWEAKVLADAGYPMKEFVE